MAKLTKKVALKIIDNFKDCHFISDAIDIEKVNPVDFYIYLDENPDIAEIYEKADKYIAFYLEDKVAKVSYGNDKPSNQILMRMIEARNKNKYQVNKVEEKNEYETKTYEELEQIAKDLEKKINKNI